MKKSLFFLFLIILASACMKEVVFKEIIINNQYSVSLPEYLTPTTGLNEKATFQYQNEDKDLYVLVIYESREDMKNFDMDYTLEQYFEKLTSQGLVDQLKNGKISKQEKKVVHGNNALTCTISGVINKTPIVYNLSVIQSKDHYYQLLIWTREDNLGKLEKDIDKIKASFKTIEQKNTE